MWECNASPGCIGNMEAWRHTLALFLFSLPQTLPYLYNIVLMPHLI